MAGGDPGVGSAELGLGGVLTKSQLGLPLFLIRVRVRGGLGLGSGVSTRRLEHSAWRGCLKAYFFCGGVRRVGRVGQDLR